MEKFVAQHNISHFEELLRNEVGPQRKAHPRGDAPRREDEVGGGRGPMERILRLSFRLSDRSCGLLSGSPA